MSHSRIQYEERGQELMKVSAIFITLEYENDPSSISPPFGSSRCGNFINIKCTISEIFRLYLKLFTCQEKIYVQVCTYLPNIYMEQTGKFQNMCNTNLADDVVISKVVHHKRCTWSGLIPKLFLQHFQTPKGLF